LIVFDFVRAYKESLSSGRASTIERTVGILGFRFSQANSQQQQLKLEQTLRLELLCVLLSLWKKLFCSL